MKGKFIIFLITVCTVISALIFMCAEASADNPKARAIMEKVDARDDGDNMTNEMMAEAVKIIDKRAVVEASGNMGDKDLLEVAKTGVDIISVGALTHTVRAFDISLKFQ